MADKSCHSQNLAKNRGAAPTDAGADTEITSLEDGRKELEKRIWGFIPPKWRLSIVAFIVIGITLFATRSIWQRWLFPEPHPVPFSGRIFSSASQPLAGSTVELLDKAGLPLASRTTDDAGVVVFSVLSNVKIAAVRVRTNEAWLTNKLDLAAVKQSGIFKFDTATGKIAYEK